MSQYFETQAIRTQTERSQFSEHSTPLYLTSSFVFDDAEDMRASFAEEKKIYRDSRPKYRIINKIVQWKSRSRVCVATGMPCFQLLEL
ncbi:hypothetical protein [Tenacibaculum sp.]|uniref:hypothetical protein n=1 Tax=Tenacibaculum sp. TaxID=1906242 RepID=UPI003AA7D6A8